MWSPEKFKQFRKDFDAAVAEIAKKHNVTIQLGNIRYTEFDFKAPVTVKFIKEGETSFDAQVRKYHIEFDAYKEHFDLQNATLGSTFKHKGHTYTFQGLNVSRPKYCIVCTTEEGKITFFSKDAAKLIPQTAAH